MAAARRARAVLYFLFYKVFIYLIYNIFNIINMTRETGEFAQEFVQIRFPKKHKKARQTLLSELFSQKLKKECFLLFFLKKSPTDLLVEAFFSKKVRQTLLS